jgi:hypothetical protein
LCFKIVPELLRMSFRGCRRLSSDSLVGALAVIVVFFLHSRGFWFGSSKLHERLLSFGLLPTELTERAFSSRVHVETHVTCISPKDSIPFLDHGFLMNTTPSTAEILQLIRDERRTVTLRFTILNVYR